MDHAPLHIIGKPLISDYSSNEKIVRAELLHDFYLNLPDADSECRDRDAEP
jgi:hypothetical protein